MSGKGAKGLSGKGAKGLVGGKGKGASGSDMDKKKPTSRSSRAGLQFPVGRIHRLLKVGVGVSVNFFFKHVLPVHSSFLPQTQSDSSTCLHISKAVHEGPAMLSSCLTDFRHLSPLPPQSRVVANGRVGATAAVYTAAILGR